MLTDAGVSSIDDPLGHAAHIGTYCVLRAGIRRGEPLVVRRARHARRASLRRNGWDGYLVVRPGIRLTAVHYSRLIIVLSN